MNSEIQLMFGHSIPIESWKILVRDGDEKKEISKFHRIFWWESIVRVLRSVLEVVQK